MFFFSSSEFYVYMYVQRRDRNKEYIGNNKHVI